MKTLRVLMFMEHLKNDQKKALKKQMFEKRWHNQTLEKNTITTQKALKNGVK